MMYRMLFPMQQIYNLNVILTLFCYSLAHMKKALFILSLFIGSVSFAQPNVNKWRVSGEVMLPSAKSNKAFRGYMNGLVIANPMLTYQLGDHFYASIAPRYMYYTVSEFKVPQKMNGGLHVAGGHLELGYTSWQTKNFAIEFGCKVGAAHYMFRTDSTRTLGNRQLTAMYYEPNVQFVLMADEAVAYRWIVGYNFSGFAFRPDMIQATWGGYKLEDLGASTQSIVVGFGISYFFGNERSDTDLNEVDW